MSSIITLTTDFGLSDAYVASMKGVMLSINPKVKLLGICHTIKPQNIPRAAVVVGARLLECFAWRRNKIAEIISKTQANVRNIETLLNPQREG